MATTSTVTTVEEKLEKVPKNGSSKSFFEEKIVRPVMGEFKSPIIWVNVVSIFGLHMVALYIIMIYDWSTGARLVPWCLLTGFIGGFGVTAGAHRLWCHQAYKAKLPLRIFLMLAFCMSGQNTLYDWVRDHRVHHKFTETDADPHNAGRGFFFSHVGWLMMKKHPEVIRRGREVDCSDLLRDPVVVFHQKHFVFLKTMLGFVLPSLVPLCWGEPWYNALLGVCVLRYVCTLNFVWLVNSAAHMWGYQPYDTRYQARDNVVVSFFAIGEGWHNYHHAFPWDYKAAELGYYFNVTTFLIDLFAKIGWAYDLKQPRPEHLRKMVAMHGDGSHPGWEVKEVPASVEEEGGKKED